ncbi:hypothetical protein NMG60_11025988 [Bertholletia excelsa]
MAGKMEETWVSAEDEEESLSLCDLPISANLSRTEAAKTVLVEEDFDFAPWRSSVSPKMCSADEVFFQGQILPLSRSNQAVSGSQVTRLNSIGSRQSSSSSGSSVSTPLQKRIRVRNQFYSDPSPVPQIRVRPANCGRWRSKTTTWGLFKLGLVRTPKIIESQDLKFRSNFSDSFKSFGSESSRTGGKNGSDIEKKRRRKKKGEWFGGCRCSVDAVEIVPRRVSVAKGSRKKSADGKREKEDRKRKTRKKAKAAFRRTVGWLKEISAAGVS